METPCPNSRLNSYLRSAITISWGALVGTLLLLLLTVIDWMEVPLKWHLMAILFVAAGVFSGRVAAATCSKWPLLHGFLAGCGSALLFTIVGAIASQYGQMGIVVFDRAAYVRGATLGILALIGAHNLRMEK